MKKIIFQNHSCKIGTHYLYDIQYTYYLIYFDVRIIVLCSVQLYFYFDIY